jgi:hypothetical protein
MGKKKKKLYITIGFPAWHNMLRASDLITGLNIKKTKYPGPLGLLVPLTGFQKKILKK